MDDTVRNQATLAYLQSINKDEQWLVAWAKTHTAYSNIASTADAVRAIQKHVGTEPDGILGPMTYRRMLAEDAATVLRADGNFILWGATDIPVSGVTIDHSIDLLTERKRKTGGLCAGQWPGGFDKARAAGKHAQYLATIHWDVAFSSRDCANILVGEGYSSVFGVDNDGTVFQWLNPGLWYGYHAASPANQLSAVSFDLSNAVALKYADIYAKKFGPRPVVTPICGPFAGAKHLGMYKAQIVSTLRVLRAVSEFLKLPLTILDWPGQVGLERSFWNGAQDALWSRVASGDFKGVITHQNITSQKWDVRCLFEQIAFHLYSDKALRAEFQDVYDGFGLSASEWTKFAAACGKAWENPGA